MKLGFSSAAMYGRKETEDAAAWIAATLPVDTCEIFLQCRTEYCSGFGREVRNRLGMLDCTSVHPKGTQFEADLFSLSPRQSHDALATLGDVCAAGEAIGARYYVMHGAWGARTRRTVQNIHELAPRMALARETAASHGLQLLWENVSWCALRTPEDVKAVRELMPEQCFVLDIKQARECDVSPFALIDAMGDRLKHVHVLDWSEDRGNCLPGEGAFDFPAFFRALRAAGFDGSVILEPYEPQARDEAALCRSLLYLRECME